MGPVGKRPHPEGTFAKPRQADESLANRGEIAEVTRSPRVSEISSGRRCCTARGSTATRFVGWRISRRRTPGWSTRPKRSAGGPGVGHL